MSMKHLICLLLIATACAPKSKEGSALTSSKSFADTWSTPGTAMTISQSTSTTGTITISYDIGGACRYDYGNSWLNDDENQGSILITNGQVVVASGATTCQELLGNWTYAVLISPAFMLCNNTGCLELH